MSLQERLARLLFIVPYAAKRDGVPLTELADKLSVTPSQIEADLELLAMVGQPPLTPDHLIDLYVEDDIVYVDLDQSLSRPPQLTHEEARALVLGAKLAGRQGSLGDALERVLDKIVSVLNPLDQEMVRSLGRRVGIAQDAGGNAGPIEILRGAVASARHVRADYYSASSDQKKSYHLQPLALITHAGADYLVARDVAADLQEKLFRLDRMGEVSVTEESFVPPPEVDLEKYRTRSLYAGGDASSAMVRFDAEVAPLVIDRFARKDTSAEADGALAVRLSTSSPAWLLRWVLPFGVHAEVLGPAPAREVLRSFCEEAARAYEQDARGSAGEPGR